MLYRELYDFALFILWDSYWSIEYFIVTYIGILYFWYNRYEDETSLSSTTLKLPDNEEICTEKSVIPNKLHADEPPVTVSAIMAIGQPEVKYAQPVK